MLVALIAGSDAVLRDSLKGALGRLGVELEAVPGGEEVIQYLQESGRRYSLILLDLSMRGKDSWETVLEIQRTHRGIPLLMLCGDAVPPPVMEASRRGIIHLIRKPVQQDEFERCVRRVLAGSGESEVQCVVSRSPRMMAVESAIRQVGPMDVPVLLLGETGVGKEVFARRLHALSPRANKPFLKLNCAALPSELIESELFGYDRGAFTGAFKNNPGKFELAEGGTILLDEIGEMDVKLQAKLLHVLQDQEFQRLGSKETVRINVRVIAATHCKLEVAILEGRFREDLYYRLNVVSVNIPPLRERRDEVLVLCAHFLRKHGRSDQGRLPEIDPVLQNALLQHDWPGNIRELENVMRRFLVFRDSAMLAEELHSRTRHVVGMQSAPVALAPSLVLHSSPAKVSAPDQEDSDSLLETFSHAKRQAESNAIMAALEATRWNRKHAARLLHTDYKALLYKMKKLGITDGNEPTLLNVRSASA